MMKILYRIMVLNLWASGVFAALTGPQDCLPGALAAHRSRAVLRRTLAIVDETHVFAGGEASSVAQASALPAGSTMALQAETGALGAQDDEDDQDGFGVGSVGAAFAPQSQSAAALGITDFERRAGGDSPVWPDAVGMFESGAVPPPVGVGYRALELSDLSGSGGLAALIRRHIGSNHAPMQLLGAGFGELGGGLGLSPANFDLDVPVAAVARGSLPPLMHPLDGTAAREVDTVGPWIAGALGHDAFSAADLPQAWALAPPAHQPPRA